MMGQLVVAVWVLAWIASSLCIILTNKFLLGYTRFKFPFMLALWHMLLASGSSRVAMKIFGIPDAIQQHIDSSSSSNMSCSSSSGQSNSNSSGRTLQGQLAAIGLLFGASLVLSNWSFMYLTVPTIQMLKASTPAVIYLVGVCLHTEQLQLVRFIKVLVVCAGVATASYGDVNPNLIGAILQICGVTADSLRICILQKVLQGTSVKAPALVTLAHVAPYTAASLVLPMLMVEGHALVTTYAAWRPALPAVILSGLFATTLNLVVFQLVRLTSALTTSLSGVIKECVCITVAMHVYDTIVSSTQWLGYFIAVAGLLWYQQGSRNAAAAPNSTESSAGKPGAGTGNAQGAISGSDEAADDAEKASLLDACERDEQVARQDVSATAFSSTELSTRFGRAVVLSPTDTKG